MTTVEKLLESLGGYRFRCKIEAKYKRIDEGSPIWAWFLSAEKDGVTQEWPLWKYPDTEKLLVEIFAFAEENQSVL